MKSGLLINITAAATLCFSTFVFAAGSQPQLIEANAVELPMAGIQVTGTATDPDGDLSAVEYRVYNVNNDYDWGNWVKAEGTENFTIELKNLEAGYYRIYLRAVDAENNYDPGNGELAVAPAVFCNEYTTTNQEHVTDGRAYAQSSGFWWVITNDYFVTGTDEALGNNGTLVTTISESPEGYYFKGECPTADKTPPQITLEGGNPLQVTLGTVFADPGATAVDAVDGDVSSRIKSAGTVDTNTLGTYTITYTVTDNIGNQAEVTRSVEVTEAMACVEWENSLVEHEVAGRAYAESELVGQTCWGTFCWGGTLQTTWYATGSEEQLGTSGTAIVTLIEQPAGSGVYQTGECPQGPQPPVITSIDVEVVADDVTITGTAEDPNDDMVVVMYYINGGGFECEGTSDFSCVQEDLAPGTYQIGVQVNDSQMLSSEMQIVEVVVEEPAAAVVTLESHEISGNYLVATGTATDINNDIVAIGIVLPGPYGVDCELDGDQFSCAIDISYYNEPGTYPARVTAVDSRGEWGSAIFEFTIEDLPVCYTDTNANHGTAGRAELRYNILYYANGSGAYLGLANDVTSLEETSAGGWVKVASCP